MYIADRPEDLPNPFTTIEDPFAAVAESAKQRLLDNPHMFEDDRLAYETFIVSKEGGAFYERWKKKFLERSQFNPAHPQAQQMAMYWEGFRACFREAYEMAYAHQQRILSPQNK